MKKLLRENLAFQSTTVYQTVYTPELDLPNLNTSEFVRISVVVKGNGIHKILNEPTECHAGDMYILDSGIPSGFFAKSEQEKPTVCTLLFDPGVLFAGAGADRNSPRFCCGIFRDGVPVSYALLNAKGLQTFKDGFEAIREELDRKDVEWETAVRSKLSMLLVEICRYLNLAQTISNTRSRDWIIVSAAMRTVLDQCSDSEMTLETIASSLFVSQSALSRMFQKVTGDSFAEYVRKIRIGMACDLLRTTSLTNEQIVARCGLKDIPSFYRLFKTAMGVTPYQYRMSQHSDKGEMNMGIFVEISEHLQKGKGKRVKELVQQAIDQGLPASRILNEGLMAGMSIIGEKFKNGQVYVPEVLVAARAMNTGILLLKPLLVEDGVQSAGKVCIGTVQGDLHDIGKNLVKMMLEGKGLEVVDLGTDVAPETFIQAAMEQNCQVICCSALLTTTMDVMAEVVKAAEQAGIRQKVKIMVGGAPVTQAFCDQIGADVYTSDAASAADAAVKLCSGSTAQEGE